LISYLDLCLLLLVRLGGYIANLSGFILGGSSGNNILAKAVALRINLNLDGASVTAKSHTHPSHLIFFCFVYYESIKRELKIKPTYECMV
jgi:hypothetical protein